MSAGTTKAYTLDTHRAIALADTLARAEPHLAAMGITRVANVTGLDRIGLPVVMVMRPNSRSVAVSQGKGLSLDAARASGIMEAIETWHAERIALPVRYAPLSEIRLEGATADIARLPATTSSAFADDLRTLWIEARDLADGTSAWLPYEMVHTDYTHPVPPGHGCFSCTTNGLASGNHLIEATCHALCEVIERDATSMWHMRAEAERAATRVRLDTIDDPGCRQALAMLADAGLAVGLWETTSNVGVAGFRCIIAEPDGRDGHIGIGDGCHPHRGIAALRAFTEAAQTRMTYISGARDDLSPEEFTTAAMRRKCAFAARQIAGPEARDFTAVSHRHAATFEDDLDWLLDRLASAGCRQVLSVDLTRPDIGIPVVRVVVPGLEGPHDDDSYRPGPRAGRLQGATP